VSLLQIKLTSKEPDIILVYWLTKHHSITNFHALTKPLFLPSVRRLHAISAH
jgi:hypothetical protein